MELKKKEFYAKGKRGLVFKALLNGKKILIKEHNPDSDANTIANEASMLKILNKYDIGPKFIAFENNMLIREFIEGPRIDEYFENCSLSNAKKVIVQILNQCKLMDSIGINKFEMTHPYKHILIENCENNKNKNKLRVVMIDFERCKYTNKPKNVTQFCQYILRPLVKDLLSNKGLNYDSNTVKEFGMNYKRKGFDKEVFQKLINIFS